MEQLGRLLDLVRLAQLKPGDAIILRQVVAELADVRVVVLARPARPRDVVRRDAYLMARWMGEVLCQTNLNALGELEMCYDVYISGQSPFFSVTQSYNSQNSGRCTPRSHTCSCSYTRCLIWLKPSVQIEPVDSHTHTQRGGVARLS